MHAPASIVFIYGQPRVSSSPYALRTARGTVVSSRDNGAAFAELKMSRHNSKATNAVDVRVSKLIKGEINSS